MPSKKSKNQYDYQNTVWGSINPIRLNPFSDGYFHLKFCLRDISGVKGKVLDIGCGRGSMCQAIKLYRPDLEVIGCDISKRSLNFARKNIKNVKFVYGNVEKLPFPDESFDAVTMFDVLEHVSDPKKALSEIRRVLKKGGVFHMSCPTEGSRATLHGLLWNIFHLNLKKQHIGHIQMFTLSSLKRLTSLADFKTDSWKWNHHLIYQTVDLTYFILQHLFRKKATTNFSFTEWSQERRSILGSTFLAFYKLVMVINFLENSLLTKIPGQTVHINLKRVA